MEKLIELINEQQKEKHQDGFYIPVFTYRDGIFCSDSDCLSWVMDEIHLISKHYGFIKWLVENDKIDIKALVVKGEMRSGWDFDNKKGDEESGEEVWNKYYSELCLMILAIQDEPISFLISILK